MHETVIRFESDYTLFTNDAGDTIGHMVAVPRTFVGLAADRVVYVGFAHDWDGEDDGVNAYDPLVAEVSDDPASVKAEIERRARDCPTCHTPQEVDGQNYFITHRRGVEPGEVCTERPAIVETEQPTASYFVAEDAYRDVHLWSGREGDDDCQPLIAQRMLDAEHPALWPALLRGLGVKVAA